MITTAPTRQLLRFATIGSVDDGKSTLIGRLLHDAKGLFDDHLEALGRAGRRADGVLDLSLVTDGLRAEREQGITIDVAYRYFATPRRSFIIGDTPGHTQYTRNMATGASTADVAVVLVDVRTGSLEQTRRHLAVAAVLGIRHVVVAVNKMDLVGWLPEPFEEAADDVRRVAFRLGIGDVQAVPVSALHGDNVVERSAHSPWYDGPTLLGHLEGLEVGALDGGTTGARLPVQLVLRTDEDGRPARRYAGSVAGAPLAVGDDIVVLPAAVPTTVTGIESGGAPVDVAPPGLAVTVRLAHDVDVARGDVLAAVADRPAVTRSLAATVCWFGTTPLTAGRRVLVKCGTRTERAVVQHVDGRLDLDTLEHRPADALDRNDIGRVRLATAGPLVVDPYETNRITGGFVLIDDATNDTLAAGMIVTADAADATDNAHTAGGVAAG